MKKLVFRTALAAIVTFAALVVVGVRSDLRNRQLPQE